MHAMVILQSAGWDVLTQRLRDMADGAEQGAIDLLLAVAVALLGWLVATLVARLTRGILRAARYNEAMGGMMGPAANTEPATFASWIVYWVLIAITAMLALDTLGFTIIQPVSERLAEVLPRIVVAAAIGGAGLGLASLVGMMCRRLFESAGMRGARLRAQAVTVILIAFTALLALEQLGFAAQFIMALGVTVVAGAGLAIALAFGLGCRELARDFVVEYLRSIETEGPRRPNS
jgi:hypothetical protein